MIPLVVGPKLEFERQMHQYCAQFSQRIRLMQISFSSIPVLLLPLDPSSSASKMKGCWLSGVSCNSWYKERGKKKKKKKCFWSYRVIICAARAGHDECICWRYRCCSALAPLPTKRTQHHYNCRYYSTTLVYLFSWPRLIEKMNLPRFRGVAHTHTHTVLFDARDIFLN